MRPAAGGVVTGAAMGAAAVVFIVIAILIGDVSVSVVA